MADEPPAGAAARQARMRRRAVVLALLLAPVAIVEAILVAFGGLAVSWAIIGFVLLAACLALLVELHFAAIENLTAEIENFPKGGRTAAAPVRSFASTGQLANAVAESRRRWIDHGDEMQALVAANEALHDAIPEALILIDGERRVTRTNAAAASLFGGAIQGRDLEAVLRAPIVLDAVDEAFERAPGGSAEEVDFLLPGSVDRYFSGRVVRLPAPTAYGDALLIAVFEMTAIRRAEQMRADFVANVSHELRTPLATLVGFIETLRGPAKDDAAARERFLAIMNEQANRMARLVRDLLSLSRIEENEHTPPTAKVDIAPLLSAAGDLLAFQARAKEIEIVFDVAPGLPAVVGDADQLAQVFQNLIDNALKYGRPKSRVRIATQLVRPPDPAAVLRPLPSGARLVGKLSAERMVAIAVADEGEGIARDHLLRLTERFYRIDAGRSRQLGGTGLGLAIVKHIVNRHRGALAIDSEPGRGSVFTVYLPVA